MLLTHLEAYLGHLDSLCVPKGLRGEPFWHQEREKNGPKLWIYASGRELVEVIRQMFLAHFVVGLWLFGHLKRPKDVLKGHSCKAMYQSNTRRGKRTKMCPEMKPKLAPKCPPKEPNCFQVPNGVPSSAQSWY